MSQPTPQGLVLRLDGEPLQLQMLGAARPANPGQHTFEAEAPGYAKAQRSVTLKEGEKQRLVLPLTKTEATPIPTAPASASASAPPPPTVSGPAPTSLPPPLPPEGGSSRKTVGYVVGGVGAVSVLLGTYFGFRAISQKNLRDDCVAPGCTSGDYSGYQTSSDHAATASTVFFGVGLAGLGLGTFLVLTAPPELAPATSLRLGPGSIHLAGSFLCARFPSFLVCSRSLCSRAAAP